MRKFDLPLGVSLFSQVMEAALVVVAVLLAALCVLLTGLILSLVYFAHEYFIYQAIWLDRLPRDQPTKRPQQQPQPQPQQ